MTFDTLWLLIFAAGLTGILIFLSWRKNSRLPPGPLGLPFVGYYPFLGAQPYITLRELAWKHGNVLSFRTMGGTLFVVLNELSVIKEVLVSRADEFGGRPLQMNLLKWIDGGLGIAQEEGSAWKEQRRFFLQTVKDFGFGKQNMEERIQEQIQQLIDDVRKHKGEPVDFLVHVSNVACNIISQIMLKKQFVKDDPFFGDMSRALFELVNIFTDTRVFLIGPFLQNVLMKVLPHFRKADRTRLTITKMIDDIVDEHVCSFDPHHLGDFVDVYLDQRKKLQEKGELQGSSFTMKRLTAVAMNMMVEGTESVSMTIFSMLHKLSHHEDVQKKVQEELDAVMGQERLPSWLDRHNLPYLEAVILELYRTSQPFNISTYYSNYDETSIKGYRIPKRSVIVANLWSINNDPKMFSEPSKFNPTRFLGPDGKRIKQEGPFPFGIGKRACVGEALAQMEVFLFVSSILQNFTLFPCPVENKTEHKFRAIPREEDSKKKS